MLPPPGQAAARRARRVVASSAALLLSAANPLTSVGGFQTGPPPALAKVQRADAGQVTSPHARRVRPVDPEARSLLTDARNRSATVRTLLARLEASDVIVYVQRGLFDRIEIEGRTSLIVTVPEARFVRVIVRSGLSADRGVEMLGHELRHAYEIATALGVRSERDLQQHFATIGFECATGRLETDAARETERSIRRELELERRLVQRGRTR